MSTPPPKINVAIVGGGPAGLMAAEVLCAHGIQAHIFDTMPSLGRKFLMAGKSGLNLSHGEDIETFLTRYGAARNRLEPSLRTFTPQDIRDWADGLGIETFIGTSGRIFPKDFKAAPLLRTWLRRLRAQGVSVHVRHRWTGWNEENLCFDTPQGIVRIEARATVLALGGASWPSLGSDAAWVPYLREKNIAINALRPANCGFNVTWSNHFKNKFAGVPLKSVALHFADVEARGDISITDYGIESGPVYTVSAPLRDAIERDGTATLTIDLLPDKSVEQLTTALSKPRGKKSMATHLKRTVKLDGVKAGLLRECTDKSAFDDVIRLAQAIKTLPLCLESPRPLAEAISCAGGVALDELDDGFMLKKIPGVFCAGEMQDWEAPTGGYLISACLAAGRTAGEAVAHWLDNVD